MSLFSMILCGYPSVAERETEKITLSSVLIHLLIFLLVCEHDAKVRSESQNPVRSSVCLT